MEEMRKLIFIALACLSVFSCKKQGAVASVKRERLFSLEYGSLENQLNLSTGLNSTGAINTDIAMRDGFFYISNGESQKILELNSYGDLLTLYHNPETNPAPLFDSSGSRQGNTNKNISTRKTVSYPFNAPSLMALDSRQYVYVAETLPKERQESGDNKILRQVVLRFNSDSFVDYIGQQGQGGTPFPFIKNIYTTAGDCLVVVCIVHDGIEVFYYNQRGERLYDTLIKYSDAPDYGEDKPGVTRFSEVENVVPDPVNRRLFVKADYYETSIDSGSKAQNGIADPVSVVFPYDLATGKFGAGIEIPPYEESVTRGFAKQTFRLPYDFAGVTKNGWLFFTITVDSGCMVQMVQPDGGRTIRRQLNFDTKNLVYSSFDLSENGIISALLAGHDKATVVWWRTDALTEQF